MIKALTGHDADRRPERRARAAHLSITVPAGAAAMPPRRSPGLFPLGPAARDIG
ncbi:hypothetical protein [Actinomadura opuntiae]|uniref:hypothetical protein n=1 Tax=Actinomadura sp. OS1-43 TaxID=604315 RepID=UPI00255AB4E8|nr:hypothetical protein [Actinomadura sp. OS1-43]MDL4817696.1 hypothetical protein [Actinomadura sp. OS1-43]